MSSYKHFCLLVRAEKVTSLLLQIVYSTLCICTFTFSKGIVCSLWPPSFPHWEALPSGTLRYLGLIMSNLATWHPHLQLARLASTRLGHWTTGGGSIQWPYNEAHETSEQKCVRSVILRALPICQKKHWVNNRYNIYKQSQICTDDTSAPELWFPNVGADRAMTLASLWTVRVSFRSAVPQSSSRN